MDNSRQSEKHDSESSSLLGKDNSFVKNRLERSLRLQRVCNRTLVHAKGEQELLQELCQSIISEGGYRFAWIGYVQNDEKQSVNPVAHAGHGENYLKALQVSWGENEAGQGPTGRAIRSEQPCIVQDIPTEPNYAPWREAAQQQGYRASMALPLTDESGVFGVLNIYASEPDAFQDEEVQSLIFFAVDLSYGIRALRTDRERKQAEEALRQSEERYQNLANNIPGMIFQTRTTLEGGFSVLYASTGCYDLYEVSPEEMMTGRYTLRDFEHPDDSVVIDRMISRASQSLQMFDQEFRIVTLSGKEKWIQAVSHPIPQADGSIVWDGVMLDIDGRKKSEDELQRALDTNQAVLNALPDVILKIGRDGIYRSIIPKNDVFLLAPPEQFLGKHLNEVLPAEIAQERMTLIEEAFCTGKTQIQEYSLWVEGKQHYEEIRCVVCSEDEVLLLVRDITESTRNKADLQKSEERLRMAISAANQGIYDLNLQTGESTISLEYALMLGYEPEELKESYDRWLERIHPEDQESVDRTFRQYVAGEIPEYRAEFRLRTKTGEWLWILSIGQIVQWDASGKPLRMLGSHTDIHKLKQAESSLRNSEAELLTVFQAMTDVVVIRDIQGRCLKVAPTNTTGFYISPLEMIGKTTDETFPAPVAKALNDAIQTCLAEKRVVETEFFFEKSARTLFFATTVSPMTETTALIVSKDVSDRKGAETALLASQKQFRNLVENSPDIIERFDLNLKHLYVSPSLTALTGIPIEHFLGKSCRDLDMGESMISAWESAAARLLSSGQKQVIEFETSTLDGLRTFEMAIVPELSAEQTLDSILCLSRDITERKIAAEALQESETRFRQLAENIQDVFWIADRELTEILYVSPTYEILWGQSCSSLYEQPQTFLEAVHPEDRDRVDDLLQRQRYVGWNHEYRILQPDGTMRWIWEQAFPVPDPSGIINRVVGISQDITERKESESQLLHNSLHDTLTRLPNRSQLIQRIELALLRVQRAEIHSFAVLFLDLDRFKNVNDSLGHLVGDQLLVKVAQRLQSKIRAVDLAARLGGDEFVILLEDLPNIQTSIQVAEKILNEFQIPIVLNQREIIITTSIGIVFGTSDYTKASEVLRDADTAMYQAKTQGKNTYRVFNTLMHTEVRERLDLENDLRKGLEREEFIIYYQPILNINTLSWVGFEALIRWNHPSLGFISPASFLPLAEETGLIISLDYWTLKTACQQMAQWQGQFPSAESLKISVNLTDQVLRQNSFIEYVDLVLAQTGLESQCLNLEITEGVLIKDISRTIEILTVLQARGIHISVDDFGTGYSSLNYLHRLPLDTLKIDRSFVSQMQVGSRNHKIVKTIITLSNELGFKVVAEGIETEQQLELLAKLECEMGQGYFFAKPMSASAVESFLGAGK